LSPDSRKHRGAHPEDRRLFAGDNLPILRQAVADLSWLLTRGYAAASSIKLVGDRHSLTDRQRLAIARAACSDEHEEKRRATCLAVKDVEGEPLAIDGFNLIITIEAALSGGVLLACRDGCLRDLSSVHGSYRSVDETETAIQLIGEMLEPLQPGPATWFLDKPVSNSGRLAERIRVASGRRGWQWDVKVVMNPDVAIASGEQVSISSDSIVLDRAARWMNFSRYLVGRHLPSAWVVDLSGEG
jgi:hypothetical protein